MKVELDETGRLSIIATTGLEVYALAHWAFDFSGLGDSKEAVLHINTAEVPQGK